MKLLLLLLAVSVLFVFVQYFRSTSPAQSEPLGPGIARVEDKSPLPTPEILRHPPVPIVEAEAKASDKPAGRRFLEEYWGASWPEVKARLDAAGENLDNYPPPTISWEQAERTMEARLSLTESEKDAYRRQLMRWNGTADPAWFLQEFEHAYQLEPSQVSQVEGIAARHNIDIGDRADQFVAELERETRNSWSLGRYVHAPYTTVGAPGGGQKGFYSKGDGEQGWSIGLTLTMDACPGLQALQSELQQLIASRDTEVLLYVKSLK